MNYLKFILRCGLFAFSFNAKSIPHLKTADTDTLLRKISDTSLYSQYLQRKIVLDILLPPQYHPKQRAYKVLYMNDGQDLERLQMQSILDVFFQKPSAIPFILVAVHCGERIQEYGTAAQADYKNRGSKASAYTAFMLEELMPYIQKKYRVLVGSEHTAICGFSLGGLSAFDMAWHHPEYFGKVGVFSGSFWWRQKDYQQQYDDDKDRIMQRLVRESLPRTTKLPLCWFQTGTEDEKDDRNQNGVIDSIEDTLDLIAELERKGYRWSQEVQYVEVEGGQHHPDTWAAVMPQFLEWAFDQ
ncbi:MAG: alpha/beta hydrolase [Runella sp.]